MKKNLFLTNSPFVITCLFLFFSLTATAQTTVNKPYFRTFLDGNAQGIEYPKLADSDMEVTGPGFNRINRAKLSNKGLVLTDDINQIGCFYIGDHHFTTDNGLVIEFEYMIYGPEGKSDGICLFMVDQSYMASPFMYGSSGSNYGYTGNRGDSDDINRTNHLPGIKGAYMGIAIDDGNFKNLVLSGSEYRNGIFYYTSPDPNFKYRHAINPMYNTRSNVTIRGAAGRERRKVEQLGEPGGNNRTHYFDEGYWGYPVLITRHTGWSKANNLADPSQLRNNAAFQVNTSTGWYTRTTNLKIDNAFRVTGEGEFTSQEDPEYRKAIITLERNTEKAGGLKINVAIQHHKTTTLVIKDFIYPEKFTYMENGIIMFPKPKYLPWNTSPATIPLETPVPDKLILGFTATSSVNSSKTQIIKNLRITRQYSTNTANDDIITHRRGPVTIYPFNNDLGFREINGMVDESKDHLDPASFRFWTDNNTCKDKLYTITDPGKGKWVYNEYSKQVLFFPERGYKGTATIMYDVKGKYPPYSGEDFRSPKALISITIADNKPTP